MSKICSLFILLGAIISSAGNLPYTNGVVIPTPVTQSKNKKLAINPASIKIKTSAVAVKSLTLAQKILLKKLNSLPKNDDSRKINLTIAKVNDPVWKGTVFSQITTLPAQGYKLKFIDNDNKLNIYAIGADNRGVFYAMTSLVQLFYTEQGKAYINAVDISDNPIWLKRYVGGYNPVPKRFYEKLAFFKISGYGIQHRYDWRKFSPEKPPKYYRKKTYQQAFDEIKEFRQKNGDLVDFMLLLNVYAGKNKIDISKPADVKLLIDKCLWAAQYVQHIMLQVDDFTPQKGGKYILPYSGERKKFKNAGDAHGYLVKKVYTVVKKHFPQVKISFCCAPYSLIGHSASNPGNRQYLADLAKQLPGYVTVVWTGAAVETKNVTADSHQQYQKLVQGQQLLLWDNTSNMPSKPLNIWETTLFPGMEGKDNNTIYINGHCFSFFWTWLFAINANDYLWNPKAYNSAKSYSQIYFELRGKELPAFVAQTRKDIVKLRRTWARSAKAEIAKSILSLEKEFKIHDLPFRKIKYFAKKVYDNATIKTVSGSVPRISKDFDLNDKEADKQWETISEFKLTYSNQKINYPTKVQVAYTPQNIYMRFTSSYSKEPNGKLPKLARDVPQKSSSDSIIIGLQPPMRSQRAGWIRIDLAESVFDNKEWRNPKEFNPELEIKRQLLADRWILTVKIPLAQLKGHLSYRNLRKNDKWRANFIRVNNIDNEVSSWSPVTGKRIEDKKFFGEITFK